MFNGVSWTVAQDWATGNTYTWTPTVGGTYQLYVWVRNSGTTTDTAEAHGTIAFAIGTPLNPAPYQPAGWSDRIVVASAPTSFTDVGVYSASATYYIAFAVANFWPGNVSGRFYVDLYDNDNLLGRVYYDNLPANYYLAGYNIAYFFRTAGPHALEIVVDSTGAVPETNEADNVHSKTVYVN